MINHHFSLPRAAFTLMEILVVVSIILVLAAIALPVYSTVMTHANKNVALNNMRQITASLISYAGQNDGDFPDENITQGSSWNNSAGPLGEKVWFNVLPRLAGKKSVGDYASNPNAFYTKDNLLYLPGAKYPLATRNAKPLFAFAINSKLQRKKKGAGNTKLSQVTSPARTVAFMEEGVPTEPKTMALQAAYEGEQKTSAHSFIERYGGKGVLTFLDGHTELVSIKDILTSANKIKAPTECTAPGAPAERTYIVWTRTPEEDPN